MSAFSVVDATGCDETQDLLAGLVWCGLCKWMVDEEGTLYVADGQGCYARAPRRFRAVFDEELLELCSELYELAIRQDSPCEVCRHSDGCDGEECRYRLDAERLGVWGAHE